MKKQKDTGKKEIMFRLCLSRGKVFRVKSLIYVDSKYWDVKKEKVVMSRMHLKVQHDLIAVQKQIDDLSSMIVDECVDRPLNKITKDWLEKIVHVFHFGDYEEEDEDEDDETSEFFKEFDTFIEVRVKNEPRLRQFMCLIRMLKRYELYRGRSYEL